MIHPGNGDFAVASFWPEGRSRRLPGSAQGSGGNIAMADTGLSACVIRHGATLRVIVR
jgi:hypothetical protein